MISYWKHRGLKVKSHQLTRPLHDRACAFRSIESIQWDRNTVVVAEDEKVVDCVEMVQGVAVVEKEEDA